MRDVPLPALSEIPWISLSSSATGIWGLHFSFPKGRQKLPSISTPLNLEDKLKKKKISLLGTYFTSCKGWSRPSTETVKKPNPVTLPPSLQTHWSLKHFQISPTVGSYRPQCPRITQRQIRRGFNTAGRNWMSGFPSVECVIIAVVHRESERWVPTCQNQAGPLSKRLADPLLHVPI